MPVGAALRGHEQDGRAGKEDTEPGQVWGPAWGGRGHGLVQQEPRASTRTSPGTKKPQPDFPRNKVQRSQGLSCRSLKFVWSLLYFF